MLSVEQKESLSKIVKIALANIDDDELPDGGINFLLHIDGIEYSSWSNITNSPETYKKLPLNIKRNLTY